MTCDHASPPIKITEHRVGRDAILTTAIAKMCGTWYTSLTDGRIYCHVCMECWGTIRAAVGAESCGSLGVQRGLDRYELVDTLDLGDD